MESVSTGSLESRTDFKNTPEDQYKYWDREMSAANSRTYKFRQQGDRVVEKYMGGAKGKLDISGPDTRTSSFRLNLFHSNVITLQSMLYGNLPKVEVSRRFNDPDDDIGRVASLIMERLLNNDIQDNGKEYDSVLRAVLEDRLLPGLGCAKVRYIVETEKVSVMGIMGGDNHPLIGEDGQPVMEEQVTFEEAPIDYYHWRDIRWGWSRMFSDIPWIGFRSLLTKDEVQARWGKEVAELVELKDQVVGDDKGSEASDPEQASPWKKAEIWEIWDKVTRKVVWINIGYDKVLETMDDMLGLSGFFPCPPFLLANATTSLYQPVSDYYIAQDLYNEIDLLQTRIAIITEAVKVVGVYDASTEGVKRMLKEGMDNDLIPVDSWALFAEKGGIAGQVDWLPIKEISDTLGKLREIRDDTIGLLQQVTGMSDIMRGELGGQYEGVGQSQLKVKFGSVRVQAMQEQFATFASDLLQLKAEVISLHFEPETIYKLSNIDSTYDKDKAGEAIELIKNTEEAKLRVHIRPESVAMIDYAQLKQERTEYLTAVASFMQAMMPIVEAMPESMPFLLQMLQWGLSGFKGSNQIEGVMDRAIESAKKAEEGRKDKPDPEKRRADAAMELEQTKHRNNMTEIKAKADADNQVRETDLEADVIKIREELRADLKEIQAKAVSDMRVEIQTSETNAEQHIVAVRNEIGKLVVAHDLKIRELTKAASLKTKESSDAA